MWSDIVQRRSTRLLVAREDERVVGFVAFGPVRGEGASQVVAEISAIYVRPAFWSTGIGRHLCLDALRDMLSEGYETIGLWVLKGNERDERAGFSADRESTRQFEIGGAVVEETRYVLHAADRPGDWRSFIQLRERLDPVPKDLAPCKPGEQHRAPFTHWIE